MNELTKIAFAEYSAMCLGTYLAREKTASRGIRLVKTSGMLQLPGKALQQVAKPAPTLGNRLMSAAPHLNEVAGLGVLAVPSAANLMGKPMDDHTAHSMELGGLGMLAAPSMYHAGKSLLGKLPHH